MRARPLAAITATVGGLALLFSFKTASQKTVVNSAAGNTSTSTTLATSTSVSAAPATSVAPAMGAPPSTTTAPSKDSTSSSTPVTSTAAGPSKTVKGSLVNTRFGDVQVELIMQGNKIVDVKSLILPTDRRRSAEISTAAEPILHDEVLQAQSAQIDLLSGATYTSDAYAQSVQGALDAVAKA